VHLTPGSYEIGFDSYDTFNGSVQPHDASLTANIAGVELANFDLASVAPGVWSAYSGVAKISTAGDYLVSFTFSHIDPRRGVAKVARPHNPRTAPTILSS
jgi:hypothetical protein